MENMVYLGLGSNVGNREEVLRKCRELLEKYNFKVVAASQLYETPPWGKTNQPGFLNQVLGGHFAGPPLELLGIAMQIETELGRVRREHWGPRTLDIDILVFGTEKIHSQRLTIPHPYIDQRAFVLVPFVEIAPDLVIPGFSLSIAQLLAQLPPEDLKAIFPHQPHTED